MQPSSKHVNKPTRICQGNRDSYASMESSTSRRRCRRMAWYFRLRFQRKIFGGHVANRRAPVGTTIILKGQMMEHHLAWLHMRPCTGTLSSREAGPRPRLFALSLGRLLGCEHDTRIKRRHRFASPRNSTHMFHARFSNTLAVGFSPYFVYRVLSSHCHPNASIRESYIS